LPALYVALVHHPVLDKNGQVVTTSVTTIDVHDIARSCRTYGVRAFYVVTPVDALRGLVRRVLRHWSEGFGSTYNPNRSEALDLVRLQRTLEGVSIDIEAATGRLPRTIATSAREGPGTVGFGELRRALAAAGDDPWLLLLGTGWGLTQDVLDDATVRLAPVRGAGDYNHLSVRAAAAVILDRLLGTG
jgi:hypothetical protein